MKQYTNEITHELRESSLQQLYDEDFIASCDSNIRKEFEDFNKQVSRPLIYIFRFAVAGSLTLNGGVLRNASGSSTAGGYKMARVGDKAVYADGSEATIISGACEARIMQGASAALVGSMLDNGDEIISTPQSGSRLIFREGDTLPKGLLTMPGSKH
ncbi:PAAR domain-containing protein [Pantoea sp. R13S299]|uniref:PAAR domain-containing protein n=1 Tax=Pantoea sp. R13S299 TaxID=3402751 RepID=UPI003AEE0558